MFVRRISPARVLIETTYRRKETSGMRALVRHGPRRKQWESKAEPRIERTADAIVCDTFADAAHTNALKVVLLFLVK